MAEINLEAMERAVNAERIGGYRTMPVSVGVMERLLSYARDLEADRDSWRDQASERLKDWDVMRVRAETAEQRIRELEQDAASCRIDAECWRTHVKMLMRRHSSEMVRSLISPVEAEAAAVRHVSAMAASAKGGKA